MNYVILEADKFSKEAGKLVGFSKRIKLSDNSHNNVCSKVIHARSLSGSTDDIATSNSQMVTEISHDQENDKHREMAEKTVPVNGYASEKIKLREISQFVGQTLKSDHSRLIRLTNSMYDKVLKKALVAEPEQKVSLEDMTSVNENNLNIENDNSFELPDIKNIVEEAFESSPIVDSVVQEPTGVKKAPYSRAKVDKYKNDEKLPTSMLSDNGLFNSSSTVSSEAESHEKSVENRVIPIVAPLRKKKFLFENANTSVAIVDEKKNQNSKIGVSLDELRNIQVTLNNDDEFEELLAKVEKRQQDQKTILDKKANAEKEFASSVQVLKSAAQKYDVSSEALADVKNRAYAYLNEVEEDIAFQAEKERELREMAQQQMLEARKIEEATNKKEAQIEQFNSVLAVVSNNTYVSTQSKTYARD